MFRTPKFHPQEDLYWQFYGISSVHLYKQSGRWEGLPRSVGRLQILPPTRLLVEMHGRNTIELPVKVFLRMELGCSKHVEDTIITFKPLIK
jgi:hypothetical protein